MRQPRLAEYVATQLRDDILEGRLREGDVLPRQEDLLADFNVSLPAVREALRILENEGLVSVRRGNVGGAVVHLPTADRVGYTIGLVLQAQQANLEDVGRALQQLEPACAAMCAQRDDRHDAVVPVLREIVERESELIGDAVAYNREARRFHVEVVRQCGSATMILVVGALETIWTVHEQSIYEHTAIEKPSLASFRASQRAHERLVAAIEAGDAQQASRVAQRHLEASQAYSLEAGGNRFLRASLLAEQPLDR